MATRPFSEIAAGDPGLLEEVEGIVLDVERLSEGVERLAGEGATFDAAAVDKACAKAFGRGFSN